MLWSLAGCILAIADIQIYRYSYLNIGVWQTTQTKVPSFLKLLNSPVKGWMKKRNKKKSLFIQMHEVQLALTRSVPFSCVTWNSSRVRKDRSLGGRSDVKAGGREIFGKNRTYVHIWHICIKTVRIFQCDILNKLFIRIKSKTRIWKIKDFSHSTERPMIFWAVLIKAAVQWVQEIWKRKKWRNLKLYLNTRRGGRSHEKGKKVEFIDKIAETFRLYI